VQLCLGWGRGFSGSGRAAGSRRWWARREGGWGDAGFGCWEQLSPELLDAGAALPAAERVSAGTCAAVGTTRERVLGLNRSL